LPRSQLNIKKKYNLVSQCLFPYSTGCNNSRPMRVQTLSQLCRLVVISSGCGAVAMDIWFPMFRRSRLVSSLNVGATEKGP